MRKKTGRPDWGVFWTLRLIVQAGSEDRRVSCVWGMNERQLTQLMDYIVVNRKRLAKEAARTMPDPFDARNRCGGCLASSFCPEHGGRPMEARSVETADRFHFEKVFSPEEAERAEGYARKSFLDENWPGLEKIRRIVGRIVKGSFVDGYREGLAEGKKFGKARR